MTQLFIVPSERHVERLAGEGKRAETRRSLEERLLRGLLPDVAFADDSECAVTLGIVLAEGDREKQLDLFAGRASKDPLVDVAGEPWVRVVAAVHRAIAVLRARGATAALLERVSTRASRVAAARAKLVADAIRGLDERLARSNLVDERLAPSLLARAIADAPESVLSALVKEKRIRARWLLAWEPADLGWWRALDERLAACGGDARVVLPSFDRPLEATRDRDSFERIADDVARGLDAPPELETLSPPFDGGAATRRVSVVAAADATAQARAVVAVVSRALAEGAPVERVAIGCPTFDASTMNALRRALDDAGFAWHEASGAPLSQAPVVCAAWLSLEAAESLDRTAVARLLSSGYVEGSKWLPGGHHRADRGLLRVARRLDESPTARGCDARERLLRTAGQEGSEERSLVEHVVRLFDPVRIAKTRGERIRSSRGLWGELGLGARAGRGALAAFTSDQPPRGVLRAERLAIARDARSWDALIRALAAYEAISGRAGGLEQPVDPLVFRLEVSRLVDDEAAPRAASRAGAVRVMRVADLPGEALDLLVVVDMNEGLLPRDVSGDSLVSEALSEALVRASQGAFVTIDDGVRRARELAAVEIACSEARRVVFVFKREDAMGAPLVPSVVVTSLDGESSASDGALAARAPAARDPGAVDVVSRRESSVARQQILLRVERERRREGFFLDPTRPQHDVTGAVVVDAEVSTMLALSTGGMDRPLAVTSLERFARCPFMGYAHVLLGARDADVRGELPDAREEGTLVHDALAAAFSETRDLWSERPRDAREILRRGEAACARVLEQSEGHAPLRAIARLRVSEAVRAVLNVAIADDAWDFFAAEQAFGGDRKGAWPVLHLDDGKTQLSLRGFIDRVDRSHDRSSARVIDYKRSKNTVRDAIASLGVTALQVPLYARVVARNLGIATTGIYAPTQPRDVDGSRASAIAARKMEAMLADDGGPLACVERVALRVASGIRAGRLVPLPAKESECRLCAVSGGCRKPRFAMAPLEDEEELE